MDLKMLYCQIWLTKMHDTDLIRYCGEEHSAAEVQQQYQVAPATREPAASHLQLLSASCYQ